MKIDKKFLALFPVFVIVYSFLVFFVGGFSGHGAAFWVSYAFTILGMVAIMAALFMVSQDDLAKRAFFLGYPVLFWSAIYGGIQLVVSIIFMLIDKGGKIAVLLEVLLLLAYVVVAICCLHTRDVIVKVQEESKRETSRMKILTAKVEMVGVGAKDPAVIARVKKLAEEFKYSDVVSNEATEPLEQQMGQEITELKMLDGAEALKLCEVISEHLKERNIICQNTKKRY
ncbi:MAG: hypothetical protein IJ327_06345 [Lachnospiraceae bacterium]|nr:hypothetical protein [Lachnospiraceae bacterium]